MKITPIKSAKQVLLASTVRDFSGGLNLLDDDLNLSSKFSKRLFNCSALGDGTISVRFGTRLFADLRPHMSTPGARIVNVEFFAAALVVVCSNGDVLRVYGDGTIARIWDSSIAAALPGAPAGWSQTDFASFAQFNENLIICNGIDKPLIVSTSLIVDYLQDLATSTNVNTPVGRYVTVCDRYLIISGDPVNPNRIHISAKDASGTFYGDPAPNDATFIDVGSVLANASSIRGISEFRGKLIVGFAEGTVIGKLGTYDATGVSHLPSFDDPVSQFGTISHRSMQSYGDDMLMMDLVGVPSLKTSILTSSLKPERKSDLVDPQIRGKLARLSFTSLEDRCFSVYNQREGQFFFFIPNSNDITTTTETTVYNYIYRPSLNLEGWARFDGWNFSCACRTVQGEVIFGDASGFLWLYGSNDNPFYGDFIDDPRVNDPDIKAAGRPIVFDWELPWTDINARMNTKQCKYIGLDTRGTGEFSASMYIDRIMASGLGVDSPALQEQFTGGDSGGFGVGDAPYGGGRNTADEHLFSWPAKFKLMKLRFRGQTTEPLSFTSVSILYQKGGFYR